MNAMIAEYQADDAISRGKFNEKRQRQATEKVIGSQRAGFAAQGVDVNSGSALNTQADAAYLGELDALTIRQNAAKEAWGYKVQAVSSRRQGKNAEREGYMGAATTVIGGAGSMLLSYYRGAGGGVKAPSGTSSYGPYASGYQF
jgi:molybdopterin biosynthesis enzyme